MRLVEIANVERAWVKLQFGRQLRIKQYARIQKMLEAGLPLLRILEELHERASDNGKRRGDVNAVVLAEWKNKLQNGARFSEAIAGWVPQVELMILSAGEDSGQLAVSLKSVIAFATSGNQIRSAITGGLAYPLLVTLLILVYIYIFGVHVIPKFAAVVNPAQWHGVARSLYLLSGFVQSWAVYVLIGVAVLVVVMLFSFRRWCGRIRTVLDRFPPYSIYRLMMGSGFLTALAALIAAGTPVDRALVKLGSMSGPWLYERIDAALFGLKSGFNLGEAMKNSGHGFPSPEIVDDLCVYAEFSDFSAAIQRVADDWMTEGTATVNTSMKLLSTMSIFMLAAVVMWLVAGFFGIQQEISNMVRHSG
jgi:type II secretory pathway component PulF